MRHLRRVWSGDPDINFRDYKDVQTFEVSDVPKVEEIRNTRWQNKRDTWNHQRTNNKELQQRYRRGSNAEICDDTKEMPQSRSTASPMQRKKRKDEDKECQNK